GREREVVLVLVVLVLILGRPGPGFAALLVGTGPAALLPRRRGAFGVLLVVFLAASGRLGHLGVGPRIGGFKVDDVTQEDLALGELVAPDDDGLERQGAFAQPGDHGL